MSSRGPGVRTEASGALSGFQRGALIWVPGSPRKEPMGLEGPGPFRTGDVYHITKTKDRMDEARGNSRKAAWHAGDGPCLEPVAMVLD